MKYTDTLKNIHNSLDKLGDLPVFNASINRIQQISSSEESDAMALAVAIMKDSNLSAKVLRLANTTTYNRGSSNISMVSRAVVLMGFNHIKNVSLTLKLIESFHDEHPDLDVPGLMMRQFLGANLAKDFAIKSKSKVDPEEAYIASLLFGLGEIIVACTLPDQYRRMLRMRAHKQKRWKTIQAEVLGITLAELGQEIAVGWGYPKQVLHTMKAVELSSIDKDTDFLTVLPTLTDGVIQQIYGTDAASTHDYSQLLEQLSEVSGISYDAIGDITLQCFSQVAKTSRDYGLKSRSLIPEFTESGHRERDEMVRQMAFIAHSEVDADSPDEVAQEILESSQTAVKRSKKQLDYLNSLGELITSGKKIHDVFKLVITAINECGSFDRSMLCLLNTAHTHLSVKLIEGEQLEPLQNYFERSKSGKSDDLFFKVMSKQVTLLVNDLDEDGWGDRLPKGFADKVMCQGFVLIPLTMGQRVIGMIYADKLKGNGAVEDEDFNMFNQFATQTRLALMYAANKSN